MDALLPLPAGVAANEALRERLSRVPLDASAECLNVSNLSKPHSLKDLAE